MALTTPWALSRRLQQAWLTRGPIACSLLPLAWLFAGLASLRRSLYRRRVLRTVRLGVPVVVVGNLVAGGAGKTPTALALLALLKREGWRPGLVSRGHGRSSQGIVHVEPETRAAISGDEPLLSRLRSGCPVAVGTDRVAAARALLMRHPAVDVIVCDDGLQHLRLARDVQVIVFDERGAGNGWQLPAGPLREPMPPRVPDRTVVLYNASHPTTPLAGHLARRALAGAVPLSDWWRGARPQAGSWAALAGRPVLAVAGIARPERFFAMLRAAGLSIVEHPLPDHHDFARLAWPAGTQDVVLTEKDAVKIDPGRVTGLHVWVAALDFAFDPAFERELLSLLPPRPDPSA